MDTAGLGLLLAASSALFNGTFGVFTKIHKARGVSPLILNYWMAEGVGLSGLLLLAVPPRVFTWWGVLSGALFVASSANAVTAISLVGLSAATGVWCGTAVVVSFLWGVLVAGDQVARLGWAAAALALILCGIGGVAVAAWAGGGHQHGGSGGLGHTAAGSREEAGESEQSLLEASNRSAQAEGTHTASWQQRLHPAARMMLGFAAAVLAGAIGGLILAPMLQAPAHARGLQFVPSMAVGALLVAPLVTAILTSSAVGISFVHATSSRAAGPGMAAGVVWNAGNCCCIAAVTNPHVGMAVAMPIMQCGLFVAGLWGILLFREIQGWKPLSLYLASGALLVAGAALLASAKEG